MKKLISYVLLLIAGFLLPSCEKGSIDHTTLCRFTFLYSYHSTSLIFVAAQNPGCYVFVSTRGDGKSVTRQVNVESNDGRTEQNTIRTAVENNFPYVLGTNNEIGLIIGMTNFDGLRAYDRCCPNCNLQRALQWTGDKQHVKCNLCSRVYSLETGVVTDGEQGNILRRYNCSFNGESLNAWN